MERVKFYEKNHKFIIENLINLYVKLYLHIEYHFFMEFLFTHNLFWIRTCIYNVSNTYV